MTEPHGRSLLLSLSKKERRSLVPVNAKATLERAVIGLAVQAQLSAKPHVDCVPLPDQDCPGGKLGSLLVKRPMTSGIAGPVPSQP